MQCPFCGTLLILSSEVVPKLTPEYLATHGFDGTKPVYVCPKCRRIGTAENFWLTDLRESETPKPQRLIDNNR